MRLKLFYRDMKRILVGILAVGIILTMFVAFDSRVGEREVPPCAACTKIYAEASSAFIPVAAETLSPQLQVYHGQLVRVRGTFKNDGGRYFLAAGASEIPVTLTSELRSCRGQMERLGVACGIGTWYDGSADVIAAGRVETLRVGSAVGELGLTLLCLERVNDPTFGSRMRYVMRHIFA
jgi:hypothetical protein